MANKVDLKNLRCMADTQYLEYYHGKYHGRSPAILIIKFAGPLDQFEICSWVAQVEFHMPHLLLVLIWSNQETLQLSSLKLGQHLGLRTLAGLRSVSLRKQERRPPYRDSCCSYCRKRGNGGRDKGSPFPLVYSWPLWKFLDQLA